MRITKSIVLGVAFCVVSLPAVAQITPRNTRDLTQPYAGPSDISGSWELFYDGANLQRATLLPQVTQADLVAHARMDGAAMRWCNYIGMPLLMQSRLPLEILQGKIETIIVASEVSVARHIYTDGRPHVDPSVFEPTSNGDSIGHWEADTFVVDTIGFAPNRGFTAIPGGGFKTATSHLVERFRLVSGGAKLLTTFTWDDRNVFAAPHTYAFLYSRAPQGMWSRKITCNPFDDERTNFLTRPPR